jgi:hypothetical protein
MKQKSPRFAGFVLILFRTPWGGVVEVHTGSPMVPNVVLKILDAYSFEFGDKKKETKELHLVIKLQRLDEKIQGGVMKYKQIEKNG